MEDTAKSLPESPPKKSFSQPVDECLIPPQGLIPDFLSYAREITDASNRLLNRAPEKSHFQGNSSEIEVDGHYIVKRPSTGQERAFGGILPALSKEQRKGRVF